MIKEGDIYATITPLEEVVLGAFAWRKAGNGEIFVEIGSWKGHSSVVISRVLKRFGKSLICIDHWKGSPKTDDSLLAQVEDIYEVFKKTLKYYEVEDSVIPMKMDSLEAVKNFDDESIDFLFLDADHRYIQFKQDLEAWYPKVKNGGFICGHDCESYYTLLEPELKDRLEAYIEGDCLEGHHIGVIKGLHDFFNEDYSMVEETRIWFKEKDE